MTTTSGTPYAEEALTPADAGDGRFDIIGQYEAFVVVPHIDARLARDIDVAAAIKSE